LRHGARKAWEDALAAMKAAARVDPKIGVYAATAAYVMVLMEVRLRERYVFPSVELGTAYPGTHLWVAGKILDDLMLSPWAPLIIAEGVQKGIAEAVGKEVVPAFELALRRRLFEAFLQTESADGKLTMWYVPSTTRLLIEVGLALTPLVAIEGMAAVGTLLSGIGEIVPG